MTPYFLGVPPRAREANWVIDLNLWVVIYRREASGSSVGGGVGNDLGVAGNCWLAWVSKSLKVNRFLVPAQRRTFHQAVCVLRWATLRKVTFYIWQGRGHVSRAAWEKPQEGRASAEDTAVPTPAQEESKSGGVFRAPHTPPSPSRVVLSGV